MEQRLENSRVLVTGGAGFIGSNLTEYLLAHGNDVVVLDNFSTGKRENIAGFLENSHFALLEGDIRDREACRKAVDGVEYVFHEAALGSVPRSVKDPMTTTDVNISGFVNMLFAAKEAGVRRFIYAASSSVYGDSQAMPKKEESIGKPLSPYAITKYVNELFAENFYRLYGIETIGLRYFNVFGRRQDPEGAYAAVIPAFILSLLRHQSPVINGDGGYSRDFTYIDNVIQANILAATACCSAVNEVFNIACAQSTTLLELFEILRRELGRFDSAILAVQPEFGAFRAGDIPHSLASIEKGRRLLGYAPEWSVERGLSEAVHWYFDSYCRR